MRPNITGKATTVPGSFAASLRLLICNALRIQPSIGIAAPSGFLASVSTWNSPSRENDESNLFRSVHKRRVAPIPGHEFFMSALVHNLAFVHHQNHIGITDRA